ncbi:hypothetical protein BH23ACT2_BH23ACT2_01610 [soil metagenome]
MISADEAARVAREAGLSIADAASLRALADDVATAERIAAKFSASDDAAERAAVRDLFGTGDPDRALARHLFTDTDTTDTTQE